MIEGLLVDRASALFAEWHGAPPSDVTPVAGDGSSRRYWRLHGSGGVTAVGAHGPDREENRAFFSFTRTFRELGLPVPALHGVDEEAGVWLLQDLGDVTLFEALKEARGPGEEGFPDDMIAVYREVLEQLTRFQVRGGRTIDFEAAYPRPAFDRQSVLWDLNYFKYHFLKLAHIPFHEARLERDFDALARFLGEADTDYFLYRDFQSRNVMLRDRGGSVPEPWFIDYQGGRRGALQYDVASLLYDAKADLGPAQREALLEHYLEALADEAGGVDRERFLEHWPGYILVRVLQALGAYGYRGFFERKPRFLQSVPYAARNVEALLAGGLPLRVPELESALGEIVRRWPDAEAREADAGRLAVHVGSFRFAGGYPQDTTGHGGGYVFDCRGLPNPGREAAYRGFTGLDAETVAYLESKPEVEEFWRRVHRIVEAHVEDYRARGKTTLTVNFGCTGGQHRSVYFAERLARHLKARHPDVSVVVTHRERGDWPRSG